MPLLPVMPAQISGAAAVHCSLRQRFELSLCICRADSRQLSCLTSMDVLGDSRV